MMLPFNTEMGTGSSSEANFDEMMGPPSSSNSSRGGMSHIQGPPLQQQQPWEQQQQWEYEQQQQQQLEYEQQQQQQQWQHEQQQDPRAVIASKTEMVYGEPIYFIGHEIIHEYKPDTSGYSLKSIRLNKGNNIIITGIGQIKTNSQKGQNIKVVYIARGRQEIIISESEFQGNFSPFDPASAEGAAFQPSDWTHIRIPPSIRQKQTAPPPKSTTSPPPPPPPRPPNRKAAAAAAQPSAIAAQQLLAPNLSHDAILAGLYELFRKEQQHAQISPFLQSLLQHEQQLQHSSRMR